MKAAASAGGGLNPADFAPDLPYTGRIMPKQHSRSFRLVCETRHIPLVESGDNRRGGYSLTPAGEELVAAFRLWEDEVRRFALAHAPQLHNIALEADAPAEADADARDDAPSGASALRD